MDFNSWLVANGFDPESITEQQRKTLTAAWRGEVNPAPDDPDPKPDAGDSTYQKTVEAIQAEGARIEHIRTRATTAMRANVGSPDKLKAIQTLCDAAVADEKCGTNKFDLDLLRLDRGSGPITYSPSQPAVTNDVIEAAVCRNARLENLDKYFDPRTLEASDRAFKGGLGLQDLLAFCARQNGWRGTSVKAALNEKSFFRSAFNSNDQGFPLLAEAGPSTYSLPNILGNIANKFLRVGFEQVDQAWRSIAATRSVNDFKQITTATLTGNLTYKKLAPSGQIQHGVPTELVYNNQADTYAIMLGISRTDLINDDTGALSTAGRRIGRGGATKINDIFWTIFLNNSAFFASGNANVITGGTSALSSGALKLADQKFRVQTDPEGLPIGSMPKILLVPPTLAYTARELMNSSLNVGTTTANTLLPGTNIFQGAYQIVTSPYMENTSYTGNSSAAWYLLADPNDLPVIEGVFVNGKDTPTVDTAEMDFNLLGIAMRGYIDFGFALQEYRGGVRAAGT